MAEDQQQYQAAGTADAGARPAPAAPQAAPEAGLGGRLGVAALLAAAWLIGAMFAAVSSDEPFTGQVQLTLDGPPPIALELNADAGRWERAWAESPAFGPAGRRGEVTEAKVDQEMVRFKVRMGGDASGTGATGPFDSAQGRRATYEIQLKRQGDALQGTYSGTVGGRGVRGTATGRLWPPRPAAPAGSDVVEPGERPRMLVRRGNLAELRDKAQTPFGKAILDKLKQSGHPAAHGLLYQLTEEKAYAEAAKELTGEWMAADGTGGPFDSAQGRAVGEWAGRVTAVAEAYDLCYVAWDEPFRRQVRAYLQAVAGRALLRPGEVVAHAGWGRESQGAVRSAGAIVTLALWGERGPAPARPAAPEGDLQTLTAEQRADYAGAVRDWELDLVEWRKAGEADLALSRLFEVGEREMARATQQALTDVAHPHYELAYAAAYRRMFGQPVSIRSDVAEAVMKHLAADFAPPPPPATSPASAPASRPVVAAETRPADRLLDPACYARAFTLVPAKWKRAVLWAWNRSAGLRPGDGAAEMADLLTRGEADAGLLVLTFLNYPLGMEEVHPAQVVVPVEQPKEQKDAARPDKKD